MLQTFFKKKSIIYIVLAVILFLAAGLRLYQLGEVPVSLYWDEVADGYNAYSLLETGKDEHGYSYPLLIRSFDDYKMPGMVYFMAIGIALFGLTEYALRFFNVVFGVIMVGATYFFVVELFKQEKINQLFSGQKQEYIYSYLGLTTAFLLAISPWHIQFTRTGYEASMATTLLLIGMLFFLKALHKPNMLIVSSLCIALSLYFYRSMFLFLAFFLPVMALIYFKDVRKVIPLKKILVSAVVFILVALPITYKVFTPPGNSRGSEVSIFNNVGEKVSQYQLWAIQSGNGQLGNIFFNKRFVYTTEILNNYFSHFTVQYFFLFGDANERHSTLHMGVMYLWELPFLLLGFYALLLYAVRRLKLTIFAWMFIAPIPAALSIFAPHALRTFNMLPMPQILVAVGLFYAFFKLRKSARIVYIIGIVGLMSFFMSSYLFNYYHHSSRIAAEAWGDGYKQMNEYVKQHEKEYDIVLISGHYWQPYVYTLFYTHYDPELFQVSGDKNEFGKYRFGGTSWEKFAQPEYGVQDLFEVAGNKKAMVVLSPEEYELQKKNLQELTRIQDVDNQTKFIIGELKKPVIEPYENL